MTDREHFEAWYGEHYTTYLPKTGGGEYCNLATLLAWKTWQQSRLAALEEAAKVCDEIAGDCWSLYKGRAPYTGREAGRADPGVQGESDGADKCADAIRALSQKE